MDVHCCTALTLGGRAVNIEGISVDHPFLKFLDKSQKIIFEVSLDWFQKMKT